ncbi:hypothetical protein M5K25_019614 [Dendrobium thyrsiflorum]|uniref:Uncharacterized protein n=1 Tax=Dendrobium thyrsiflorum TaxID=117978 RepID=A0ABD0UF85_DENTH
MLHHLAARPPVRGHIATFFILTCRNVLLPARAILFAMSPSLSLRAVGFKWCWKNSGGLEWWADGLKRNQIGSLAECGGFVEVAESEDGLGCSRAKAGRLGRADRKGCGVTAKRRRRTEGTPARANPSPFPPVMGPNGGGGPLKPELGGGGGTPGALGSIGGGGTPPLGVDDVEGLLEEEVVLDKLLYMEVKRGDYLKSWIWQLWKIIWDEWIALEVNLWNARVEDAEDDGEVVGDVSVKEVCLSNTYEVDEEVKKGFPGEDYHNEKIETKKGVNDSSVQIKVKRDLLSHLDVAWMILVGVGVLGMMIVVVTVAAMAESLLGEKVGSGKAQALRRANERKQKKSITVNSVADLQELIWWLSIEQPPEERHPTAPPPAAVASRLRSKP